MQAQAMQPQAAKPQASSYSAPDIVAKRRKFTAFEANKDKELAEAQEARRYYHSKQWTDKEVSRLNERGQPVITDNRIGRKIDFLVGVEQRMRRDPKGFPRTPQHENDADAATAAVRFVCDVNRWEQKASNSAHDGMVSNLGGVFIGVENGEVIIKWFDNTRFFYDPRSRMPDFSDSRYCGVHLWMDIEDAVEQWPQHEETLRGMMDMNAINSSSRADVDQAQQWADLEQSRVRVVEFWEKKRGNWEYCFFCGETTLDHGVSPYLDEKGKTEQPYVAWSAYVDEKGNRYGVVRAMKSMQDEINHRRSKFLHMLNVRQVFVRTGMVEDVDKLRAQLARPDGVIEHNGEWNKEVGLVDNSDQIRGQAELLTESQAALENLGPNPGLIGKGGGVADQSGRAILAQRDSGMTELSPVFERLRDWKLRCYRAIWNRIKQSWTGERWIRVTDDKRTVRFVGINQYKQDETGTLSAENVIAEIDVDIIMDEGPDTVVMKEELLQTMSQLGEAAAGPMGKIMIELSNVPDKEALLKMLDDVNKTPPEVAEMQKRMAQLEEMMAAISIDEKRAAIENKRADTIAKLSGAMQPAQQQTDEFGNPMGPPPADPGAGLMTGLNALMMFPLQYGQPLLEERAEQMGNAPPMPQGDPGMQGQPPMDGMPPPDGMPLGSPDQGMAQNDAVMSQAGALPVDPSLGAPLNG